MKAVLLVRVSTQDQDYEAQTHDLIVYANSLGFSKLHIIQDKESGVKLSEEERNGLNQMKIYLRENPDCKDVFIWEISRLARTEKVLHSIKEWLVNSTIQLHIFDKRIKLLNEDGTENPNTSLIFSILGSFASQEAKTIKARFNRGKKRNKELGRYNGGIIKYGYTRDENGYFIPNPETASVVKMIYELYATGRYSISSLTEELQARGVDIYLRAVTRILQEECYCGGGEIKYPILISQELYNKCKEIRQSNNIKMEKTTTNNVAFARKLMRCDHCGYNYSVKINKIGYVYYCTGNTKRNLSGITPKDRCENKVHMLRDWLDAILWYVAKPIHFDYINHLSKEDADKVNTEIEILEKKMDVIQSSQYKWEERKDRIVDSYMDGLISQEKRDQRLAQLREMRDAESMEFNKYFEERAKLVKIHRRLLGIDPSPIDDVKADLTLEQMNEIVKQHITKVELKYEEKHNKIIVYPVIGDARTFYFKRSSKKEKIYIDLNGHFKPFDNELNAVVQDYWKQRKGV